tara:strand:- start:375 stop:617 length:243 start_codon:yes stop_codon:yes gene_type:complete
MDRDYIVLPDIENQWSVYEAQHDKLLAGGSNAGKYALFVNKRTFQFKLFDTLSQAYKYIATNTKRGYEHCLLQQITIDDI